jgi:hypothetical protein
VGAAQAVLFPGAEWLIVATVPGAKRAQLTQPQWFVGAKPIASFWCPRLFALHQVGADRHATNFRGASATGGMARDQAFDHHGGHGLPGYPGMQDRTVACAGEPTVLSWLRPISSWFRKPSFQGTGYGPALSRAGGAA